MDKESPKPIFSEKERLELFLFALAEYNFRRKYRDKYHARNPELNKETEKVYLYVINRLKEEIQSFSKYGELEKIKDVYFYIKKRKTRDILIARSYLNNSLLFYLLGLTNVNPMPRFIYCKKCKALKFVNRNSKICANCRDIVINDGYDLPFKLLEEQIKEKGLGFSYFGKRFLINKNLNITIFKDDLIVKAIKLGLRNKDITNLSVTSEQALKAVKYIKGNKNKLKSLQNTIISGSRHFVITYLNRLLKEWNNVKDIDSLTKANCLATCDLSISKLNKIHITNDKNNINLAITSSDELFNVLSKSNLTSYEVIEFINYIDLSHEVKNNIEMRSGLHDLFTDCFDKDVNPRYIFFGLNLFKNKLNLVKKGTMVAFTRLGIKVINKVLDYNNSVDGTDLKEIADNLYENHEELMEKLGE